MPDREATAKKAELLAIIANFFTRDVVKPKVNSWWMFP